MKITIDKFQGIAPKISPDKLPPGGAQTAMNCSLGGGDLRPLRKPLRTAALGSSAYQGLFQYVANSVSNWVAVTDDVDTIRSPMAQDTYERLYYSGQTEPRVIANNNLSTPFSIATDYFKLGIPAPIAAPTVARSGSVVRYYAYTFVNSYGEEGPPSPIAGGTDVAASPVGLSALEATPADRKINAVRFYRTAVGTAGTAEFRYVLEATWFSAAVSYDVGDFVIYSNALYKCTGTHTAAAWNAGHFTAGDDVADSALGELLKTTYYDPPPAGLKGLILHPGGFAVGYKGNELYLSEPYLLYAWPESYRKPVEGTIKGIGIIGDTIVVLTDGYPYFFSGSEPGAMIKTLHPKYAPCLSKRSVVSTEKGVFFASSEGLMLATLSGIDNITSEIFRADQWAAYYPSAMHADFYQGKYFGWYSSATTSGCVVVDMVDKNVTTLTIQAYAGHISTDGNYYIVMEDTVNVGSKCISEWEGDDYNNLTYQWVSGKVIIGQKVVFPVGRVYIDTGYYDNVMALQEENNSMASQNATLFDQPTLGSLNTCSLNEGSINSNTILSITDLDINNSISFRWFSDDDQRAEKNITDDNIFRMTAGYRGKTVELSIMGNIPVRKAEAATSAASIMGE